jgi:hypothetical protein
VSLVCRLRILEFLHFCKCDCCILVDNHSQYRHIFCQPSICLQMHHKFHGPRCILHPEFCKC